MPPPATILLGRCAPPHCNSDVLRCATAPTAPLRPSATSIPMGWSTAPASGTWPAIVIYATIQNTTFTRPADFDCLAFVLRSISNTPNTWRVEVLLHTTLAEAQRIVPPEI